MLSPDHYLNLQETDHAVLFEGKSRVWEALKCLKSYIDENVGADQRIRR